MRVGGQPNLSKRIFPHTCHASGRTVIFQVLSLRTLWRPVVRFFPGIALINSMSKRGSDVRTFLAWQRELGGSFVPLGEPEPGVALDEFSAGQETEVSSGEPPVRQEPKVQADVPRGGKRAEVGLDAPPIGQDPNVVVDERRRGRGEGDSEAASDGSAYGRIEALIPPGSPLRSMRSLEEVADYVRRTILLPIDETRTNAVPGVGNPHADLMVIGEAPGADEDRLGEPFVGKAGMLLNKILEAIQFRREEVFIANILKSRPPQNRDPEPQEVAAHIPILYKQIALIRPKLILCVGRIAGSALLGRPVSLKELRGQFHDFHGLPVLVTYHPAALLRNPQWKRPTWEDVQMLRARYDELSATA